MIRMTANISIISLVNSQVDFVAAQGSVVRGAARGLPIKSVAVTADRPVYYLVGKENLASISALKGKTIGLNALGGSLHLMRRELIAHHELDPDKDVAMIVSGDHKTAIESVRVGRADATVVSVPWQSFAKKLGLKIVAYYGDVLQMPLGGLGVSEESIQKKGDTINRVLRATLKGIGFIRQKENKPAVITVMANWFGVDSDSAADSYDQMILAYPPTGRTSDEILEKDLEISRQVGAIKGRVPFVTCGLF
jgi:NitT/TauT family transport system substrate-binding protein